MSVKKIEQDDAVARLRNMIAPGDTIYVINVHTSRSGMTRFLKLLIANDDKSLDSIAFTAAKALGWGYSDKHYGIKVEGCGMDMGFHTVYCLSQTLFGADKGYELKHRWTE